MDFKVDMESIIKIESTMVGDDQSSPVKAESEWKHRERRMKNCRGCKLMKTTYSSLNERCVALMKENDSLEKKNTELEEINGSLYLSLESVQREKERYEQICKSTHPNRGSPESTVYEDKYFNMKISYDKVVAKNSSYKKEIENLQAKLVELRKKVNFKDGELNMSRIRFSKMNQEYLTLKLKYGEDESFMEEHQSKGQERFYKKATSEIIPSSYLNKRSFPSSKGVTSDDLTLVCQLCSEKFPTRTSLRSHTGHCRKRSGDFSGLASPPLSPSKQKILKFGSKRKGRKSTPAKSKDVPQICSVCDRIFSRPCNLGRHLKVHSSSYALSVKGIDSQEEL